MTKLFVVLALSAIASITCKFAPWNAWSACSVECGRGITSRERIAKRECGSSEIIQRKPCVGKCKRVFRKKMLNYFAGGELLSKGKKVSASSAFLTAFKSGRIVDGNTNNDFFVGKSCFMTDKDREPWIMVDLTSYNRVLEVVLYNRGDCCQSKLNNLKITVGYNKNGMRNGLCAERRNMNGVNVARMLCFKPLDGRYVFLTIPGPQFLTVCELEVYGQKAKLLKLKSATAKNYLRVGYGPKKAFDNKVISGYHSKGTGRNWWRVDLGRTAMVYELDIRTNNNDGGNIEGSIVSVWRKPSSGRAVCVVLKKGMGVSNTRQKRTQFLYKVKCAKPLTGRYIKILRNEGYLNINEFRARGYYV